MSIHTETDMSNVRAQGDLIPEGWYHVRCREVKESEPDDKGEVRVQMQWIIQAPETMIGEMIFDQPSLQHKLGLSKLKTYYKAVGYTPGPEGHDPEKLTGTECYVAVEHKPDKKNPEQIYANVVVVRSLQDGPGKKIYPNQPR